VDEGTTEGNNNSRWDVLAVRVGIIVGRWKRWKRTIDGRVC